MYDPALGRFIQPDSIIPDPESANGFDRYAYVNNNPINFNDPGGHRASDGCADGNSSCDPTQQDALKCQEGNSTYCSFAENHPYQTAFFTIGGLGLSGFLASLLGEVTAAEVISTGSTATSVYETVNSVCRGDCSDEINTGINSVYRVFEKWKPIYVGITKNLEQRSTFWLNNKGWVIKPISGLTENLSRSDARAIEQYLIEYYGLPNLENQINSIASTNPAYSYAMARGISLLNQVNFFGD